MNCSQYYYKSATDEYICEACVNGYFLDPATDTCNTTCANDEPFVAYLDPTTKKVMKNICKPLYQGQITNCLYYTYGYIRDL